MIQIGKAAIVAATFLLVPAFAQNITASEAAKHVGEQATVCGKIVSEHTASQSDGQPTFINLDRAYPNQEFTALFGRRTKQMLERFLPAEISASAERSRCTEACQRLLFTTLKNGRCRLRINTHGPNSAMTIITQTAMAKRCARQPTQARGFQQERLQSAETGHTVSVGTDKGLVLVTEESQNGSSQASLLINLPRQNATMIEGTALFV